MSDVTTRCVAIVTELKPELVDEYSLLDEKTALGSDLGFTSLDVVRLIGLVRRHFALESVSFTGLFLRIAALSRPTLR